LSYLLDTNVVSEWAKPHPHSGVVAWLEAVNEDELHLSVATVAELRYGVALLAPSDRQRQLDRWLQEELLIRFSERILPIDDKVALIWGDVRAERQRAGRAISTMDAVIAATARVHALALVTRNVADFQGSIADIINPWDPGSE
jgi:predicted nucleic acid-binding protein